MLDIAIASATAISSQKIKSFAGDSKVPKACRRQIGRRHAREIPITFAIVSYFLIRPSSPSIPSAHKKAELGSGTVTNKN